MLYFAAAFLGGLLLTPERRILRSTWFAAGCAVAILIALPNFVWQASNGFPMWELLRAGQNGKNVILSPAQYLLAEVIITNPLLALVWIAGLVWCLRIADAAVLGLRLSHSARFDDCVPRQALLSRGRVSDPVRRGRRCNRSVDGASRVLTSRGAEPRAARWSRFASVRRADLTRRDVHSVQPGRRTEGGLRCDGNGTFEANVDDARLGRHARLAAARGERSSGSMTRCRLRIAHMRSPSLKTTAMPARSRSSRPFPSSAATTSTIFGVRTAATQM